MKTHTKIALTVLAVAAGIGGTVYATRTIADEMPGMMMRHAAFGRHGGPGGMFGPGPMIFDGLDSDADGKVTKAEVEKFKGDNLTRFDTDKDGTLSQQEFKALFLDMTTPLQVRGFQMLDADGDGKVTAAEIAKPVDRAFIMHDSNRDGVVERDDLGGRGPRRMGEERGRRDQN